MAAVPLKSGRLAGSAYKGREPAGGGGRCGAPRFASLRLRWGRAGGGRAADSECGGGEGRAAGLGAAGPG